MHFSGSAFLKLDDSEFLDVDSSVLTEDTADRYGNPQKKNSAR